MNRRIRAGFRALTLTLAAAVPWPTLATEITIKNDSLDNGSTAVIQSGFVAGERAAAWLTTPCAGNIVAVQVFWASISGGTPDSLEDSITVFAAGTFPVPGATLDQILGPVMVDGYLNEFRYKDQLQTIPLSIPVTAGQTFVVVFEFLNSPDPGNGPSVTTDSNGCQPGKNGLFAIPPGSWFNSCALSLSGDFVIRAVVDGPTCGGGTGTGACCNTNGTCTDGLTASQCGGAGGTYQGDNTLCVNVSCPPPATGACCLPGGSCVDNQSASQCAAAGGTYGGNGSTCASTSCAQAPKEDYLLGQGLGQPNINEVKVYTDAGLPTAVRFSAYGAGAWGVNVATADIDAGGDRELLTGPGPGDVFGPQVRAFKSAGTSMGKVNFYAYGTLKFGTNVSSADVEGDAFDEILTGPGPGAVFGPHVRAFNFDATSVSAVAKINFFAYSTLKFGTNVSSGSVDADAFAELLTGPGPGAIFGPQVRGFNYDGVGLTGIAKINFNAFSVPQYGVNLAGGDVDGDGFAEIATTPGPGAGASFPSEFVGFDFDGATVSSLPGFVVTPYATTFYGGRVGLGDVDGDGSADLLTGAGRDMAADATVYAYGYVASTLTLTSSSFNPFPTSFYGVNVAAGDLGY